jgi:hypothetical protein
MRTRWLATALWLLAPAPAAAEWQIRPFVGFTFGGATTFLDPEDAAGRQNPSIGVSAGWLGDVFGLEGDFSRGTGFFQADGRDELLDSGVNTLTGNFVVALPRRMAEYGLRPYFVAGAGLMHVSILGKFGAIEINSSLPVMNLGGGVTGFVNDRLGVSWDVRRFNSLRREGETRGNSFGNEALSFWRATMAVAVRY